MCVSRARENNKQKRSRPHFIRHKPLPPLHSRFVSALFPSTIIRSRRYTSSLCVVHNTRVLYSAYYTTASALIQHIDRPRDKRQHLRLFFLLQTTPTHFLDRIGQPAAAAVYVAHTHNVRQLLLWFIIIIAPATAHNTPAAAKIVANWKDSDGWIRYRFSIVRQQQIILT
jgi:hypothetical protein